MNKYSEVRIFEKNTLVNNGKITDWRKAHGHGEQLRKKIKSFITRKEFVKIEKHLFKKEEESVNSDEASQGSRLLKLAARLYKPGEAANINELAKKLDIKRCSAFSVVSRLRKSGQWPYKRMDGR